MNLKQQTPGESQDSPGIFFYLLFTDSGSVRHAVTVRILG